MALGQQNSPDANELSGFSKRPKLLKTTVSTGKPFGAQSTRHLKTPATQPQYPGLQVPEQAPEGSPPYADCE